MTQPMTDWSNVRRKAHEGRYLWGSVTHFRNDQAFDWLKRFKAQAPEHGAEVVVENGYIYVTFPEDMTDADE